MLDLTSDLIIFRASLGVGRIGPLLLLLLSILSYRLVRGLPTWEPPVLGGGTRTN